MAPLCQTSSFRELSEGKLALIPDSSQIEGSINIKGTHIIKSIQVSKWTFVVGFS